MNQSNVSRFARKRLLFITDIRIQQILWYVIECYLILLDEKTQYSKKWVEQNASHTFEDYLKFRFVEDYLKSNKKRLEEKVSELDKITFFCELQTEYINTAGKINRDQIDIYINNIEMKEWNEEEENIYFAIECKRIKELSDVRKYLKDDTEEFTNRKYNNLRLPFEGQMAFIENADLNHKKVADEINERLKKHTVIHTLNPLAKTNLHSSFTGSYLSKHKKNFDQKQTFSIYHLMFDYSGIVVK